MTEKDQEHKDFATNVIRNLEKNGFPEKKVSFPLDSLYEAAYKKGLNFNKVLDILIECRVLNEKTPEKIIFFVKQPTEVEPESEPQTSANPMDAFTNMNMDSFKNMDVSEMMGAASQMMKNMSPDQLKAAKDMYENMTPEQKAQMMEQLKKSGLF